MHEMSDQTSEAPRPPASTGGSLWREPYFTDRAGREWHVYDVARRNGRLRRLALRSPLATTRVFVAEDRTQLVYAFGEGEPRETDAAALEHQLRAAKSRESWANTFQPARRARP